MKRFFTLALLLCCCRFSYAYDFYLGGHQYSTSGQGFHSQAGALSNIKGMVIVASRSRENVMAEAQWQVLHYLDAEALQLIYISARVRQIDSHGYHTDKETAEALLQKSDFRVILLGPQGRELVNSDQILDADHIAEKFRQ